MTAGPASGRSASFRVAVIAAPVLLLAALCLLACRPAASQQRLGDPQRIKEKAAQARAGIESCLEGACDPRPAAALLRQAKARLDEGQLAQGEALIDRALTLLGSGTGSGGVDPTGSVGRPESAAGDLPYEKLRVIGEPGSNGIYDPALEYEPGGGVGWLTYTSADGFFRNGSQFLHTHLAKTVDGGRTWRYVKRVNKSTGDTLEMQRGRRAEGYWHYEVCSMVHDPGDLGREWKMFCHKLFWTVEDRNMPAYGWIIYKDASRPDGEWSKEVPLFGAGRFPPAPYDFQKLELDDLHRDLRGHVAYSEPGTLVKDGILYLSLSALSGDGVDKIVALASRDHALNWEYVGVLLDRDDAARIGARGMDGSALFMVDGRVHLLAVPIHAASHPELQNGGTYVLEIEAIERAKIRRDENGDPIVLLEIEPMALDSGNHGAGQGDYDVYNTYGGIVFPQINLADVPEFAQIFNSKLHLEASAR